MSNHLGVLSALGLSVLLAACGGNGGGGGGSGASVDAGPQLGSAGVSNAVVEGAWSGSNSVDNSFDMLLLEDGELYQVYGSTDATTGAFTALGLSQGLYSVKGDTLTVPFTQYNYVGARLTGTLSAKVVAGISIAGTASGAAGTTSVTFSAKPTFMSHSGYSYNTPAAISDIAGPWSAAYLLAQNTPFSFAIDSAGALAGTNLGCSFTGTVKPRSTGKNVFDVSLSFGQAPCVAPGTTITGVGYSYVLGNGKRQFTAALQTASKSAGTVLYAQR